MVVQCEGPGQAGIGKQYSEQTLKSLEWIDQSLVNMDLIEQLICQIVTPHKLINMWPVSLLSSLCIEYRKSGNLD